MPKKTSISGSWLAFWLSVILILAFLVIGILTIIEKIEKNQYQWDQEVNQSIQEKEKQRNKDNLADIWGEPLIQESPKEA